ncbi:hypothetical protein [Rhabdothermincola salaria]|uniref:hypothetical protein n=1 Tax=Rhabdothermincola salaria TaxID=2903142 RepID=UPI001E65265D|nr:hypothetical protein [Rhabdothermincola salaria]MCD9625677.1 hypothetical protein [Rhabdothermincola salaria]
MPKSLSHVVVFTEDLEEVVGFCVEVARISTVSRYEIPEENVGQLFGWSGLAAPARAAFIGEGPGSLDVIEIPEHLRGDVSPGMRLLAVVNRDIDRAGAEAAEAGHVVRGPFQVTAATGAPMSLVEVTAGGLPFELVQFG